jgi:hypothetical protein
MNFKYIIFSLAALCVSASIIASMYIREKATVHVNTAVTMLQERASHGSKHKIPMPETERILLDLIEITKECSGPSDRYEACKSTFTYSQFVIQRYKLNAVEDIVTVLEMGVLAFQPVVVTAFYYSLKSAFWYAVLGDAMTIEAATVVASDEEIAAEFQKAYNYLKWVSFL